MYTIKKRAEDFIVQEITSSGEILNKENYKFENGEGNQLICVMKKRSWETILAVREIARRLHISRSRIGYAGMKDKKAVTSQIISIFDVKKEDVEQLKIKDIEVIPIRYSNKKIDLGNLEGNHFKIIVYSNKVPKKETKVPNFYGEQRFGSIRRNSDIIGRYLLEENFEGAVMTYLCQLSKKEKKDATESRKKLKKEKDFKAAYDCFPNYLKFEKMLLSKLAEKVDYIEALKALPQKLVLMFVHAYQSKLFNEYLEKVIERKLNYTEGPIFGYKYQITNDLEKEILEKNKVWTDNFLIREFPKLSMKGTKRNLFIKVKELKIEKLKEKKYLVEFSLPKAAYATVVIDQLFS